MKNYIFVFVMAFMFLFPQMSFGYKITTVSPAYPSYNYGGYNYGNPQLPPMPPPPPFVQNVPYNNSTFYNYYNRARQIQPLISESYKGTKLVLPYGYTTSYSPPLYSVKNYGTTTVKQYYTPSTSTTSKVMRYYY